MDTSKYFVLRQYYGDPEIRSELYKEIKLGRFRQGWGIKDLDLRQSRENWITNYITEGEKEWPEEKITKDDAEKRYWLLYPMREIRKDDFILILRQPNDSTFIIAKATEHKGEVYSFDNDPPSERNSLLGNDFRHIINLLPTSIKEVSYNANINSLLIKKKVRGYQKGVNNVWDTEFIREVNTLWHTPETELVSNKLDTTLTKALSPVYSQVLGTLRKLHSKKLEELVESIFSYAELKLVGRNTYKNGGDIDRIFELPIKPPLS